VGHLAVLTVILKLELKVVTGVERFVGVEKARGSLGRLAEQVAEGDEVWLTKRGRPLAVMLGREDYDRLRAAANRAERAELAERLAEARRRITDAGLDPQIIDDTLAVARQPA
jgi:prevent-host-death family protein